MKLNILYFGLIAEALKKNKEVILMEREILVDDFKKSLIKKYPILHKLKYQIAINQKIAKKETIINQDSEIALLPPFAGG